MFCLEKLKVFDRALTSVANLAQLSANGDKRHAVVDQLMRASESVVLNLAEGVRLRGSPQRQHVLDYSIGSALECAACLDIGARWPGSAGSGSPPRAGISSKHLSWIKCGIKCATKSSIKNVQTSARARGPDNWQTWRSLGT